MKYNNLKNPFKKNSFFMSILIINFIKLIIIIVFMAYFIIITFNSLTMANMNILKLQFNYVD